MKIKISADSTCDLSPELIARYNIGITPLYIVRGDETLRDGIDVHPEELYAYAKATGKLCQTAAVNVSDYYAYFSAARAEYDAVIHFTISSDMSGCYQNACIAAREFTNVYPVDARNLSTGCSTRPRWPSRAWTRPTSHRRWRKSARSSMSASCSTRSIISCAAGAARHSRR